MSHTNYNVRNNDSVNRFQVTDFVHMLDCVQNIIQNAQNFVRNILLPIPFMREFMTV